MRRVLEPQKPAPIRQAATGRAVVADGRAGAYLRKRAGRRTGGPTDPFHGCRG